MVKREETLSDGTVVVAEGWTLRDSHDGVVKCVHANNIPICGSTKALAESDVYDNGYEGKRVWVER